MEVRVDDAGLARLIAGDSSAASRWAPSTIIALRNAFGLLDCCYTHQDIRNIAALRFRGDSSDAAYGRLVLDENHSLRVNLAGTSEKQIVRLLGLEEEGRD